MYYYCLQQKPKNDNVNREEEEWEHSHPMCCTAETGWSHGKDFFLGLKEN